MNCGLLIGGNRILKDTFPGVSQFYPSYTYPVANAGMLDLSTAIGCARRAGRASLSTRLDYLKKAAQAFTYQTIDIEHAVHMTGMPVTQVQALFQDIPRWLEEAPRLLQSRFSILEGTAGVWSEAILPEISRLYVPPEGFCYAVIPGNDPRSSALLAANLGLLGIPFILKASPKDAVARLVLQALVQGGFDPNFGSVVYFETGTAQAAQKHRKLVDAASCIWTFGPDQAVDEALRFETRRTVAQIDLSGISVDELDARRLGELLTERGFEVQSERLDHFEGKIVLRHNSGNCAAVACGPLTSRLRALLYEALAFPLGCMATKSVMAVAQAGWVEELADFMAGLVTGNPLNPQTQVGYIAPQILDYLQEVVRRYRWQATIYGGERLSPIQARPQLIACQADTPDLFGQEIQAYELNVRICADVEEAIGTINRYTGPQPRLAVSLLNVPADETVDALGRVRAHTVLIDQPTTRVIPIFHEGNDYTQLLSGSRLLVK